uniref:Uncharacterized protein n=1 Tax=Anopheles atroparvus TaxID=41427 RepID=A0A182IXX6_ANOAO
MQTEFRLRQEQVRVIVKEEEQISEPTEGSNTPKRRGDSPDATDKGHHDHDDGDEDDDDYGEDDDADVVEKDYVLREKASGLLPRYGTSGGGLLTTSASLFEESLGLSFAPAGVGANHYQEHQPVPPEPLNDDIALMVGRPDELGYFQCPIGTCDRKYKIKYSLLRHLRNECLADRRYACPKCDKKFCYSFILNRHLLKVHKEPGYP